jgi:hypothetical protein
MLSGFSLARCISIQISVTPSDLGVGLIPVSERSNQTSFMIHMYIEIDVEDRNYLYQILIGYTCMLRICCKPMMFIT